MHAPSQQQFFTFLGPPSECSRKGHSPKECRLETWKALSRVRQRGLVNQIGVSNFNVRQFREFQGLKDDVAPIEGFHETFDYCLRQGISVTAWSSFSGTALQIAAAHNNVPVSQILLKWAMQKGAIVIPGSGNPKHVAENLNADRIVLTEQEMDDISNLRNDESAQKFFAGPQDDT